MELYSEITGDFRLPSETAQVNSRHSMDAYMRATEKPFSMKIKISREQKDDLLEAFNLFDLDGDGKVTNSELRVAIRALGFEVKPEDIKKLKESAKVCVGIDSLSYKNFLDLMEAKMLQPDETEEIIKYFNLIDTDGKGRIDFNKLKGVATALGEDVSDEVLQEMLFEAGPDVVTLDGLIRFIRSSTIQLQELYNRK
ncbi:caltractin-like [Coccinella septempunctata]|uniref:caltractin-like n=1 Tax=Coccinella septempunctata TaxID=41139 RepID=UPI001D099BA0|nr:caltractin-like [Coccinella septempunctata]